MVRSTNPAVTRFNIVTLMVLFSVMSYFDRTIMSVAAPVIIKDFGLSETQMGAVFSAFLLGYALMMIPGGHLADRFGPRCTLIVMGFGAGLFTGLTGLGTRPGLGSLIGIIPALLTIRFLMGVCTAPLYPSCAAMNANWFPVTRQGLVWGLIAGGAGMGAALSPFLFSWMIPHYGWRKSFWLAGAMTALLTAVWAWYARDRPSEYRSNEGETTLPSSDANLEVLNSVIRSRKPAFAKLLANRNVILLAIGYMTVSYFEYIFFFWIYYYFGKIRHMSGTETSTYTTVIFLAWVVMSPLGGWFSDRLVKRLGTKRGRPIVPVVGMLAAALLLFLGTHLSNPMAVGALLALSFGAASSTDGSFWAATMAAGKENTGAACGILNTGSNVGGFIAPVLTPLIASFGGWSGALYFACVVVAVGAVTWLLLESTLAGCTESEVAKAL